MDETFPFNVKNPNFPSAYASTTAISFTVAKCSSGTYLNFNFFPNSYYQLVSVIFFFGVLEVCTLRLDFCTFTTAGPVGGSDATAAIDTFQVTAVRL